MKETQSVYGTWNVKTEGDAEGRTTKHLGTHIGYIDDIALHLADKCYYSLNFEKAEETNNYKPTRDSVDICLNISSGTWDMSDDERIAYFKNMFKDRNVEIDNSNYYASVRIVSKRTDEEIAEQKKQKVLNKLSDEDKEILGLI